MKYRIIKVDELKTALDIRNNSEWYETMVTKERYIVQRRRCFLFKWEDFYKFEFLEEALSCYNTMSKYKKKKTVIKI